MTPLPLCMTPGIPMLACMSSAPPGISARTEGCLSRELKCALQGLSIPGGLILCCMKAFLCSHIRTAYLRIPDRAVAAMQAKMVESAKAKGGKEIPVPKVTRVPSYNTDYLPTFREPNTYIRGRGKG